MDQKLSILSLTINVSSVNDKPISIGSEIQSKNALEDADPFFVFDSQIEFAPGPITAIDEQDQTLSYRFDFLETSQLGTFEINEEPISTEDTFTLDQVKLIKFRPYTNANSATAGSIVFSLIVSDNLGAETVISNTIGIDAVNDVPVSENGRLVSLLEDSGISNVGFESINFSAGGGIDEATQEIYVAIKKEDVIDFATSTGNGFGQLVFLDPDDTSNLQYLNEQYFGDSSLAILTEEEVKQLRFKTDQNSYGIQKLEYYIIIAKYLHRTPMV